MKSILQLCSLCLLLLHAAPAKAASNHDLEQLLPFLDPYTVGIAQLNLEDLDISATSQRLLELLPEPREFWAEPITQAQQFLEPWHQQFRQAGGQRLYILLSLSWLSLEPPVVVVAPLTSTANAESLKTSLALMNPQWQPEVMHGCVVTAPEFILRHLQSETGNVARVPPERWQTALATTETEFARLVLVPYPESDRVLASLLPTLPSMLGGGPGSILTRGFRWASLSLQLPPPGAITLTIQSDSPESATALGEVIKNGLDAIGRNPELQQQIAAWDDLLQLVHPVAVDDQLRRRLDLTQLSDLVQALQPPLAEARAKAAEIATVNRLKQIGLSLHIYAVDHADQFPPHLVDLLPQIGDPRVLLHPSDTQSPPADLMTQPREAQIAWIERHSPFVYALPSIVLKEIRNPATTVAVYERPEPDNNTAVGATFADGSVRRISPEELNRLLNKP
jgi:hypothetical protein